MNYKKDTNNVLKEIQERGFITEREINLLKNRLNHNKIGYEDIKILFENGEGIKISNEQTEKGLNWLKNKGWTTTGKERKNSPFGYREEEAIKTFKEFKLIELHNNNNYYQSQNEINNYVPVYLVIGKKNNFEYYMESGTAKIIG